MVVVREVLVPSPAGTKQQELLGWKEQHPQTPAAAKHLHTHAVQQGEVPGGRAMGMAGRGRTEASAKQQGAGASLSPCSHSA